MARAVIFGLVFAVVGPFVVCLLSFIGLLLMTSNPERMSVEVLEAFLSLGYLKKWLDVSFWKVLQTCTVGGILVGIVLSFKKLSGPTAILLFPTYALSPLAHRMLEQVFVQEVASSSGSWFLHYVWTIRILEWLVATWILWKFAEWVSGKLAK